MWFRKKGDSVKNRPNSSKVPFAGVSTNELIVNLDRIFEFELGK